MNCFEFLNEKMEEALSQSDEYSSAQKQSRIYKQKLKKIEKDLPVFAKELGKFDFGDLDRRYDEIAGIPENIKSGIAELEGKVSKMWFDNKEQARLLAELERNNLLIEQAQTFLADYPREAVSSQANECEKLQKSIAKIEKQTARNIILQNKNSEQVEALFNQVLTGQKFDEKTLGTYGSRFVEVLVPKRSPVAANKPIVR